MDLHYVLLNVPNRLSSVVCHLSWHKCYCQIVNPPYRQVRPEASCMSYVIPLFVSVLFRLVPPHPNTWEDESKRLDIVEEARRIEKRFDLESQQQRKWYRQGAISWAWHQTQRAGNTLTCIHGHLLPYCPRKRASSTRLVLKETLTVICELVPSLGVTDGARLAVVGLVQSRKYAGDKAAMWQDVKDF